ncbi:hypothetical protein QQZ08_009143 [Neonectria magnoliae]|uniref:Uncharacterized protein n=1 Tax=Neonectria magnoliae TaxID=2732573 RepID=A0ABR1HQG9_9HYPO
MPQPRLLSSAWGEGFPVIYEAVIQMSGYVVHSRTIVSPHLRNVHIRMAEAIGLAASIIAVVDPSLKVISKCKDIIETAKEAPRDLRTILVEISSLRSTLENLQFLTRSSVKLWVIGKTCTTLWRDAKEPSKISLMHLAVLPLPMTPMLLQVDVKSSKT